MRPSTILALAIVVLAVGCEDANVSEGEGEGDAAEGEGEGAEGEGDVGEGEGEGDVGEGEGEGDVGEGEGEGDVAEGEGDVGEGEGDVGEGEGEGEVTVAEPLRGLRLNEVACEGSADRIELTSVADVDIDLSGFLLTDNQNDLRRATILSGTLAPGGFVDVVPDFGIACDETVMILPTSGLRTPLASVTLPGDVAGGSFGRLPDGTGDFALNTPSPAAANIAYSDPAAPLFQPLSAPLRVDFAVDAAGEQVLRSGAYTYVQATMTVAGNGIADAPVVVGLRKKGKVGSRRNFDQKMAFKIDIDRFVPNQTYRRLRKINLNNMVQDRSTLHEQMAYRVLSASGLPAPRAGNVTVFINGVEFGTYLMLEAFDEDQYLEREFSQPLVAMFEGGLTEAACCDFTDVLPNEITRFEYDGGDEAYGRAELAELSRRLNSVAGTDVFASLDPIVDWDQLLRTMAVEATIGHWDGYQVSPNNFYLHFGHDERWRLVASGVDQTFAPEGRVNTVYNGAGQLFRRCREDPVCSARYNAQLLLAVEQGEALLAAGFDDDITAIANNHLATFSRARLEESAQSFENNMLPRKDAAIAYFIDRLRILRQAMACDRVAAGTACHVNFADGTSLDGTCGNFTGGFGCR